MGVIVASDELRPFFDAILAAPEDDAPRLELARLLTERGDARGEHIRLSCEFDKLERDDPARVALAECCAKLPSFAFFTNVERNFPHSYLTRRGFVEEFSCSAANFVAHADWLMRAAPIRIFNPNPAYGQGALLATSPALAQLRCLKLSHTSAEDRAAILASPHLAALRELEMSLQLDDRWAVAKLAWEMRHLGRLRVLRMDCGRIEGRACAALAKLAKALRLELLDVCSTFIPASGVAKLRARLGESRVLPRLEPRVRFRFGVLDLSAGKLSVDEIRALIESGEYRSAVKLVLEKSCIGDAGLAHLARSGAFPSLTELDLADTGIMDAGARVLAHEAVSLDHLESLSLGDVPAESSHIGARDGSGVSNAVVHELARSPRLPALRSITRYKEYRYTHDGHEGREVIPIKRDDGREVESIILHMIWP